MSSRFTQFVSHTIRPVLLRLLRWTESAGPLSAPRSSLFLYRQVHIPSGVVAAVVCALLTMVLFLEMGPGWGPLLAAAIVTAALGGLFTLFIRLDHPDLLKDEDAIALLGFLLIASALGMELWFDAVRQGWASPYGIPLAAASVFAGILIHPRIGVVLSLVLGLLSGILSGFSLEAALVVSFGGIAGVARSLSVRSRGDLVRVGLWVVIGQGAAVLMIALLERWGWPAISIAMKWAAFGGLVSTLAVLILLPFLELFFSRVSHIRLLELSDVNHPLLKRMSLEAPGTYHHSLIMASLASAAAERIGANALLCRVGAYFHDIGKLAKPEYFVENQGALGNPHEPLPANMSRIVIQSHVKDGLALAQRHNLDPLLMDFITMHHGTSRIEYFYRRAIEQTGSIEEVDEDTFRYPGPRPQTKETAIVMMADSVEASTRTLEDPTHQRLTDHVERIVDSKIADGQFADVPLTLAEIRQVKESFVNTLVGVYHTRIKYPTSQETERQYRSHHK